MVRWRSETIVQWIDRFEAPLAKLDVARDGLNTYAEDELTYLWKQTFADNISGEEIQIINTHTPRYVDANSLQDVQSYLDGTFDTQLFRSPAIPKTGSSFLFFLSLQWKGTGSRSADDDVEQVLYMSANLAFHGEAAGDGFDGLDFCKLYSTFAEEVFVGDTLWIFQLEVTYNIFEP